LRRYVAKEAWLTGGQHADAWIEKKQKRKMLSPMLCTVENVKAFLKN